MTRESTSKAVYWTCASLAPGNELSALGRKSAAPRAAKLLLPYSFSRLPMGCSLQRCVMLRTELLTAVYMA